MPICVRCGTGSAWVNLACLQDSGHAAFVADRAELLLWQATRFGLHTRVQCLEYLGKLFRVALNVPERKTNYQVMPSSVGRMLPGFEHGAAVVTSWAW